MYLHVECSMFFKAQVSQKEGVGEQLEPVIEKLVSLLDENLNDDDDTNDEVVDKKLTQHLCSTLSVLALQLPADSPQCSQVHNKRTLGFL